MVERITQELDALNLTAYSSPAQKEAAYATIWREIGSMDSEESICILEKRLNSLSIPSSLPEEILCNIFEIASPMATDPFNRFNKKQLNFLLSISHVSSVWRYVAVGFPRLWANLSIFDSWPRADCIDDIISRSSGAPLSIYASLSSDPSTEKLRDILNANIGRLRSLAIIMAPASRLRTLLPVLTQPAPVLEYLHLQIPYAPWNTTAALTIPNDLFQGSVPQLRTLILRNCSASIGSPLLLPSLTELSLTPMRIATPSYFLRILQLLPKLQTLTIGDLNRDEETDQAMLPAVHLPELHKLVLIHNVYNPMLILLSRLTFPHDTTLQANMTLKYDPSLIIDGLSASVIVNGFGDALMRHVGHSQYLKMEHNVISCGFTLGFWSEFREEQDLPAPLVSTISLSTSDDGNQNRNQKPLIGFLRALFHSIRLEHLEVLHVHNVGFNSDDWSSIFGAFPALRTIQINSRQFHGDEGFMDALWASVTREDESIILANLSTTPIPFRALKAVVALYWQTSLERLKQSFTNRKAAGVPVPELRLINIKGITSEDAEQLGTVVDHVSWIEDDTDDDEGDYNEDDDNEEDD